MKGFLFFDIDGTLVDSANGIDVTDEVLQALQNAKANGWGCFICSGRSLSGLQKYRTIGMDGYIFSDGAGIMIEGEEPEIIPIAADALSEMIHTVTKTYGGEVFMSGLWNSYASDEQYELMKEFAAISVKEGNVSEAEILKQFGLHRLAEYDGEAILEADVTFPKAAIEAEFVRTLDPRLEYISTSASYGRGENTCGEVTARGITKGFGVQRIVSHYHGDMKHTYAFGDSMNDASALLAASTGVCMGNGAEELKQLADYVTDDIGDHGLVKAMRHFGIIS